MALLHEFARWLRPRIKKDAIARYNKNFSNAQKNGVPLKDLSNEPSVKIASKRTRKANTVNPIIDNAMRITRRAVQKGKKLGINPKPTDWNSRVKKGNI